MVDAHDAVVLLEEALLLRLAAPLQTLDQQAKSPETFRDESQRGGGQDIPGVWGGAAGSATWDLTLLTASVSTR